MLTGRGADIIIDDLLKPEEALSQVQWQAANDWFDHTLYSRLNDTRTGAIILIMHRPHEDDHAGQVLGQEDCEVVCFPAIAEKDEVWALESELGQYAFTRRNGTGPMRGSARGRSGCVGAGYSDEDYLG